MILADWKSHVKPALRLQALSQVPTQGYSQRLSATVVRLIPRGRSSPISPDLCLAEHVNKLEVKSTYARLVPLCNSLGVWPVQNCLAEIPVHADCI